MQQPFSRTQVTLPGCAERKRCDTTSVLRLLSRKFASSRIVSWARLKATHSSTSTQWLMPRKCCTHSRQVSALSSTWVKRASQWDVTVDLSVAASSSLKMQILQDSLMDGQSRPLRFVFARDRAASRPQASAAASNALEASCITCAR